MAGSLVEKKTERNDKIYEILCSIVGSRRVSTDPEELYLYSWSFVNATDKPGRCDYVVMPETVEEVQQIVKTANIYKIPITAAVSQLNFGGVATPRTGGIYIDLRKMNRVLEVDEDSMYALIEGGTTWSDLKGYLDKNYPDLVVGITWSPPGTGVVPCALESGFVDLSLLGGCLSEWINGLEVVLPTGEIVKTGVAAYTGGKRWFSRAPGPDITGLFIGWVGKMGIVTKMAIRLWPRMPRSYFALTADTYRRGVKAELAICKAGGPMIGVCDMCSMNLCWNLSDWGSRPVQFPVPDIDKYFVGDHVIIPEEAGIPDFYGLMHVAAATEEEMDAKVKKVFEVVKDCGVEIMAWEDQFKEGGPCWPKDKVGEAPLYSNMPLQEFGSWNYYGGGGGEWDGAFLPWDLVATYYEECRKEALKVKRHCGYYNRVMSGGHYQYGRVQIWHDKDDPKDVELASKLHRKFNEICMTLGGIRYKPQYWATEAVSRRIDGVALKLMHELRKLIDPNGIMNPGHGYF